MVNPSDFLPHPPWRGPPLPKMFSSRWSQPQDAPTISNVELELDRMTEDKRRELLAKYPDRPFLVEKSLTWARGWTSSLIESDLYSSLNPAARAEASIGLYKFALEKTENWIRPFLNT